ncbi:MAG: DUF1700 domain-containing protein [Lachnospiraceae bacterium]|nr:DUF1700 domain-containing protein [Lachnospiraceae bacterium]
MTRTEYMNRLEQLLSTVPETEREEALSYYSDYFEDANGSDDEVIASLGSPEEIAESIKLGLSDNGEGGVFTETGFESREGKKDELGSFTAIEKIIGEESTGNKYSYGNKSELREIPEPQVNKNDRTVLMIVLFIICLPMIIGVLSTVFGLVVGAISTIFGIGVGLIGAIVGLFGSAIALVIVGIATISQIGLNASLVLIGAGLICAALGVFCIWLEGAYIYLVKKLIPLIIRFAKWVWHAIFGIFKKEEVNA